CRSHSRTSERAGGDRVRRLRVPLLAGRLPLHPTRGVAAEPRRPLRLPPLSPDRNTSARIGRLAGGGGGVGAGSLLGDARAALSPPEGVGGRRPAPVCDRARPRSRALRARSRRRGG